MGPQPGGVAAAAQPQRHLRGGPHGFPAHQGRPEPCPAPALYPAGAGGAVPMSRNRRRPIHLHVMVSEEELTLIRERMAEAGVQNMGAFVRKMALNGYVLHVDLGPVRELVSLQRRCSNNLNQVAIQVNTYGGVYPQDIALLQKDYPHKI